MPAPIERYNMFRFQDEITVSRMGKKVIVKGRDGTSSDSDSVEANLLFEILKTLKRK